MAKLTITIDDEILRRARVRAVEQGTSVNSVLRDYLASYAAASSTWEQAAGGDPPAVRSRPFRARRPPLDPGRAS